MKYVEKFDFCGKGFLLYNEYVGLALKNNKKPLKRKDIGDVVMFDSLVFSELEKINEEVFNLLSEGTGNITVRTLSNACKKLNMRISEQEINMVFSFIKDLELVK